MTYVFDVDGVLIWHHPSDPTKDWRNGLVEKGWLSQWEGFQLSNEWRACVSGQDSDTRSSLVRYLSRTGGEVEAADDMIHIWLNGNGTPNEEAVNYLKSLRAQGKNCAIGSNQDSLRADWLDRWLEDQGIGDIPRFVSARMGCAKPDPAFFQRIGRQLGVPGERLFLFDDMEANVKSALAEGWQGLQVTIGKPTAWPEVRP